jgi:hypothetical protein
MHRDRDAKAELKVILKEVLPKEAQDALKEMFSGKSEQALLISNLPEREEMKTFEHKAPHASDAYSYYIGSALYEMYGISTIGAMPLTRERGTDPDGINGSSIHRDSTTARYGGFAARYNGEHADTQVIDMIGMLEAIPAGQRRETKVEVVNNFCNGEMERVLSLDDLLMKLKSERPGNLQFVRAIKPVSPSRFSREFEDAVDRYSAKIDLQPGQLLILDEGRMFHRAHKGNASLVPQDNRFTRILIRTAGTPDMQER